MTKIIENVIRDKREYNYWKCAYVFGKQKIAFGYDPESSFVSDKHRRIFYFRGIKKELPLLLLSENIIFLLTVIIRSEYRIST